jgi:hypothetical protein
VKTTIGISILLAIALIMAGCSSNSSSGPNNINGTWTANLTNTDGSPAYQFSTTFTQDSGSDLSITNFTFTSPGTCFAPYTTEVAESGSFTLSGNLNGQVTGTFAMTITTMFPQPTNDVLTLQGNVSGNTISGTWTVTGGTGCNGNGSFTLHTPMAGA